MKTQGAHIDQPSVTWNSRCAQEQAKSSDKLGKTAKSSRPYLALDRISRIEKAEPNVSKGPALLINATLA
ncbi:hypothetical protein [Alcaligenes aquatilis]|uniref:Uncharacterized protein n=1 Tax=Alcaligenes aquatilis TaxID=323284 RepID=A0A3G2HVW3_9BURK|nr:hypothetical protein [Alcaligenes aquatilis]AYN21187.1 hypothetical protein D3M96_12020 [Alcaligenes aquatilis]